MQKEDNRTVNEVTVISNFICYIYFCIFDNTGCKGKLLSGGKQVTVFFQIRFLKKQECLLYRLKPNFFDMDNTDDNTIFNSDQHK